MVRLARPRPDERILNLACGSGTLLIERLALGRAALTLGNDISDDALKCSAANLAASGQSANVNLLKADAGKLPLRSSSIDTLVADLPFGMLVGSGDDVKRLYPTVIAEAARIAAPHASLVVITARKDLLLSALDRHPGLWELVQTVPLRIPFKSGYIGANIFHAQRTSTTRLQ
jgi:23S rRNA G2445 N2-methylase RlmL